MVVTISQILDETKLWPLDAQVELVQRLEDQIAEASGQAELTEQEKALLDQRLADHEANPRAGRPWDQVKAEILARIRR